MKSKKDYYLEYYKNCYSRKDYIECAIQKEKEHLHEIERLKPIITFLKIDLSKFNNVLVVGSGTGGLCQALNHYGVNNVYGIEPDKDAVEIAKNYSSADGIDYKVGYGEDLPYENNFFDYIFIVSVLEHVNDVKKTLKEMYRVLSPGGGIYIDIPDYRFPFEPHFKSLAPTFLGKTITIIYFFLRRKNISALYELNWLNRKKISKYLLELDINNFSFHHHKKNTSLNRFPYKILNYITNIYIKNNITPTICLEIIKEIE